MSKYYKDKIFPKLEANECSFNWIAALFGFFWFPYKGLWREFRLFYVYFGVLLGMLAYVANRYPEFEALIQILGAIIQVSIFIRIGKTANQDLYDFSRAKSIAADGGRKRSGIVATSIFFLCLMGLFAVIKDYVNLVRFKNDSVARSLSFEFIVKGQEMLPSFGVSDSLRIDKTIPLIYTGDIVAYKIGTADTKISRVIAIARDKIERKDGIVTVNGREVKNEIVNKAEFIDKLSSEYQHEKYLTQMETNEDINYFILVDEVKGKDFLLKLNRGEIFINVDNRTLSQGQGQVLKIKDVLGVYVQ